MEDTKFKERVRNYIINVLIILVLLCVPLLTYSGISILGEPVKQIEWGVMLSNHVYSQNLTLPVPNRNELLITDELDLYLRITDMNIDEYHNFIKENYYYEDGTYDCKYWAYVWTIWFKGNSDEWDIKYVTTHDHIFVLFHKKGEYCIADLNRLKCYV